MEIFSKRLKELRQLREETQKDVAKNIGISERQFSILENNKSIPTLETVVALADYFGCSLDYITGRSETRERQP